MIFKILNIINSLFIIGLVLKNIGFKYKYLYFPWCFWKDNDLWIGYRNGYGLGTYWSVRYFFKDILNKFFRIKGD